VKRTVEANERGQSALDEDTVLRRSLVASSLGRERVGLSLPKPAPTHKKYKHDSEAYKRRESPVDTINKMVKKGDPVNGVRIG
jgi:hypothetical protein